MNTLFQLTEQENQRQKLTLNLIASENYPSKKVLDLLGAVWSNKYGEGYPSKRFYAGNQFTDEMESLVQAKALEIFDKVGEYGVNLQVLSGSPANRSVYLSVLEYGDKVLSPELDSGGHLTHMHDTSSLRKFVTPIIYKAKKAGNNDYHIDIDDFKAKILEHKPKLAIIGFSAYPKQYKFAELCEFAHQHGVLVLADVAHINGLIAVDLHDSPFKAGLAGADFISMTTHKTFRGPRGAMLFAKNYLPDYFPTKILESFEKKPKSLIGLINKTIFPGSFGGPHFNKIAATGQACLEILGEDQHPDGLSFRTYSEKVLENTKTFESELAMAGLEIISPTENHLCLVKLPDQMDSLKVQRELEEAGVITNRNKIPEDLKTAWKPSGMRFGLAALTSRGLTLEGAKKVAQMTTDTIFNRKPLEIIKKQGLDLAESLNWWY